jgi:hypothetical protein
MSHFLQRAFDFGDVDSFVWVRFALIFIIFVILILGLLYNPYFSILQYSTVPYNTKTLISIYLYIVRIRKNLSYSAINIDTHYCDHRRNLLNRYLEGDIP